MKELIGADFFGRMMGNDRDGWLFLRLGFFMINKGL